MRKSFFLWTQNSYSYTLFPNSDNLSTFSNSRLSIALADEKKLRNNVSYFPLVHFSNLRRKSSFTKIDLVFHMNYYFGIYFRESIALFIHTRVLAVKHP